MLVVTDLRCWFHKFLKFVVPECGSGYRRKTPRVVEIRPLGCRESAGSNLARSTGPLCDLPAVTGSANRRVDQIHLSLFTADYVPVQSASVAPVISLCRAARSDYEYFELILLSSCRRRQCRRLTLDPGFSFLSATGFFRSKL